jgi:hypothetical protein
MASAERWTFAGVGQGERVKAQTPDDGDFTYQTSLVGSLGLSGTLGWQEGMCGTPPARP